jgi:hypothetical protein
MGVCIVASFIHEHSRAACGSGLDPWDGRVLEMALKPDRSIRDRSFIFSFCSYV